MRVCFVFTDFAPFDVFMFTIKGFFITGSGVGALEASMIDVLVPITRRLWWLSVLRLETSHDIFFLEESADDDLVDEALADLVILLKFRRNKLGIKCQL